MLTNNQKNEFDEMKSQMQVLKNHLSDSEIVSREMLDATIKSSAKNLISKRLWNIVAIVAVLLMAGFIAYVCLSLHKCSGRHHCLVRFPCSCQLPAVQGQLQGASA